MLLWTITRVARLLLLKLGNVQTAYIKFGLHKFPLWVRVCWKLKKVQIALWWLRFKSAHDGDISENILQPWPPQCLCEPLCCKPVNQRIAHWDINEPTTKGHTASFILEPNHRVLNECLKLHLGFLSPNQSHILSI